MTTTLVDPFAVNGFAVTTTLVDSVDNQGEACLHCSIEGHDVDATVYGMMSDGRMAGLFVTLECCCLCIKSIIAEMDPTESVKVELLVPTSLDTRMHTQDCTCVHPDAL